MAVYINGMEMPKNCFLCQLSYLRENRLYCYQTKDEVLRAKIADNCPLIEVPPHGRLIDADALMELYADTDDLRLKDMKVPIAVIRQNIMDLPAIIPAAEGGG